MFLTTLEHAGWSWKVDLNVIPAEGEAGLLEFSFSHWSGGDEVRVTWQVSGESLQALSERGAEVSEELLRRQLDLALTEARPLEPRGSN